MRMPTVVIAPYNVATFPEGGGHFWVYLQYVLGLRQLGCEVYWLEAFRTKGRTELEAAALAMFRARMERYGLGGKCLLYVTHSKQPAPDAPSGYLDISRAEAEAIFARADLLLNFHYAMSPALLAKFRRTALVDIDPGLLQFWISRGQMSVARHDFYFTISENVGKPGGSIPDCGLGWIPIRPAVCLEHWPYVFDPHSEAFTTVSLWDAGDWVVDRHEEYENTKRVAFLEFVDLPENDPHRERKFSEKLACPNDHPLSMEDLEPRAFSFNSPYGACPTCVGLGTRLEADEEEWKDLEDRGWRVRHSREVAASPEMYQAYIQRSRGEFGCAKPSYIKLQTAWISDRTVCYLASGKPVVVQDTGPSSFLPNGEGVFRFVTPLQATQAFDTINADYERHCRAARRLAETHFDAKQVIATILSHALDCH